MTIINTVSSSRFSLNGVHYLKNYISAVHGSRVEIFNCYERADVLLPLTLHSQVSLNGTVYGTAALLQAALLNVIYSRANLGLGGLEDQDNIDIKKTFRYTAGESTASILGKINNLASYTVNEKQSVWFVGKESVRIPSVLNPGVFPEQIPIISLNPATVKYKMLNKGKGIYGAGGIQLSSSDIELVYTSQATNQELEDDPETHFVNFTLASGQTIVQWLNTRTPAVSIQPQDEGYTIFKGFNASGEALSYLWLGDSGPHGVGQQQAAAADFQLLQNSTPAPYIPTFQQTLQQNPQTTVAAYFKDEAANILMAVAGGVIKIKYANGKTIYINGTAPLGDFLATIPQLTQNDYFLMRSEIRNRWMSTKVAHDTTTLTVPQLVGANAVLQIGAQNMLYNDFSAFPGFNFNSLTGTISGFDFYAGYTYNINFLL